MAIRPKVGVKVGFTSWRVLDCPPPPMPWTGKVVEVKPPTYWVRRDADGEVVNMFSSDLYYPKDS